MRLRSSVCFWKRRINSTIITGVWQGRSTRAQLINDERDRPVPMRVGPQLLSGACITAVAAASAMPTSSTGSCPLPCRCTSSTASPSGAATGSRRSAPSPSPWACTPGWAAARWIFVNFVGTIECNSDHHAHSHLAAGIGGIIIMNLPVQKKHSVQGRCVWTFIQCVK